MLRHFILSLILTSIHSIVWAAPLVQQPPVTTATTNTTSNNHLITTANTIPLVQNQTSNALPTTPTTIAAMQQQYKQDIATQKKRLALLEQANQTALAQNQELQLKNDNLSVQVQVLQSERSAQMFIYGAITFAGGLFSGVILFAILSSRRRRQW